LGTGRQSPGNLRFKGKTCKTLEVSSRNSGEEGVLDEEGGEKKTERKGKQDQLPPGLRRERESLKMFKSITDIDLETKRGKGKR